MDSYTPVNDYSIHNQKIPLWIADLFNYIPQWYWLRHVHTNISLSHIYFNQHHSCLDSLGEQHLLLKHVQETFKIFHKTFCTYMDSILVVVVVAPALVITPIPCLRVAPVLIIGITGVTGLAILLIVWWLAVRCWWLLRPCGRVLPTLVACLSCRLLWIPPCLTVVRRWILSSCRSCGCWLGPSWSLRGLLTCTMRSLGRRMWWCVSWMYLSNISSRRDALSFLGRTIQTAETHTRHN